MIPQNLANPSQPNGREAQVVKWTNTTADTLAGISGSFCSTAFIFEYNKRQC